MVLQGFRQTDIDECAATNGWTPDMGMAYALEIAPTDTFTIVAEGIPVGMFGAVAWNEMPGWGIAWLLCTENFDLVKEDFKRQSPLWFDLLNRIYPILTNWVDDRNETTKRWLKHVGCKLVEKELYGDAQLPFWRFERRL
jgi:hypothetical protein